MQQFYTKTNSEHIRAVCASFLSQTYKIQIPADALETLVHQGMAQVKEDAQHSKDTPVLEDLNKRTIIFVKNMVRQAAPNTAPSPPAGVGPSEGGTKEEAEEPDEEAFMARLQQLEMSRKMPPAPPAPPATPAAPAAPATEPSVTTSVPIPAQVATVFMPAPPRKGFPLILQGMERPWMYSPDRASWVWAGPFPSLADSGNTKVCCMLLPKHVAETSPFVVVQIQGAGGQLVSCALVPDGVGGRRGWDTWRPCMESMGYIPSVACPWTIRILGADANLLALGHDSATVIKAARTSIGSGSLLQLFLSDAAEPCTPGDALLLRTETGTAWRMEVRTVTADNGILVACPHAPLPDPALLPGAGVLFVHKQATLILETTISSHKSS